jgi:hypothetical protein
MNKRLLYCLSYFFLSLLWSVEIYGQFYNGHQMTFGKNRVQYNRFYWSFIRADRFDTYFNENGRPIAEYTISFVEKTLPQLESLFDYKLSDRIIFVVYNKLTDFRQSNIGLITGKSDNNIGGVTKTDKNKVFLYFDGDYRKFEQQIVARITEVIVNEMIYGSNFRTNVTNSTLINLPAWYIQGLVAYISEGWNFQTENRVKDGILSQKYKKFNRLVGEDAKYAGQAFWRYVAETYGKSVVPSIIYMTKVNKSAKLGFLYVTGVPIRELSSQYYDYYTKLYTDTTNSRNIPDEGIIKKKPNRKQVYQQIKINPNGKYVAYVTNQMGQYKVWIHNLETGKRVRILKREHKLEQITDYSFPVLAWHPSGRILTFITEEQGGLKLYFYTFGQKDLDVLNLLYFEKVLDYSFSDDGSQLVMSAVKEGQTDIYVHNLAAGTNFQVTNDIADDFNPRFIHNSSQIIFSSDRYSDSLSVETATNKVASTTDLFIYDYNAKSDVLMRLSDKKYVNKTQAIEVGANKFLSLSDRNGIINRYFSKFDSTLSFVDTSVHYRYYALTKPLTNYPRNILEQDYNTKTATNAEVVFNNGRYYMYNRPFKDTVQLNEDLPMTNFREKENKTLALKDSLQNIEITDIPIDSIKNNTLVFRGDTIKFDSKEIDINNYIFEIERINMFNSKLREKNIMARIVEKIEKKDRKVRIYQKAFYQNYIVNQIDFSFLSESYQAFTGGAVYFNPGISFMTKIGTNDLFEDYKITGGISIPLDFQSSEFLLSFENLKKRLDKQYIFHRQEFKSYTGPYNSTLVKTITNEFSAVYRYPFTQVSSWVNTFGLRSDKTVFMTDYNINNLTAVLNEPNIDKYWGRFKTEYIFDNTRSLGVNIPAGSRFKIFAEYYQQINKTYSNLVVLGADFRYYLPIHRNIIWANRFATSTSLGSSRVIYYLGGVDNWTNFNPSKTPTFIPLSQIRIDQSQNYAFQAVATNMRGFSQNIRNGNNFALINSEIRCPIFSYLANYPLSSAFFENFQVIGFFDIGSAWSGTNPWSNKNAYDNDILNQGNIQITIDADRGPVVAGYGFGVRSTLLGYFVRLDWAWGIENMQVLPWVFYFSLCTDF